jgi:hypothetical protein
VSDVAEFSLIFAAAALVTSINMSYNNLMLQHAAALGEQLQKFSTLKHLDLSGNTELGCNAVIAILSSLSGMQPKFSLDYLLAL